MSTPKTATNSGSEQRVTQLQKFKLESTSALRNPEKPSCPACPSCPTLLYNRIMSGQLHKQGLTLTGYCLLPSRWNYPTSGKGCLYPGLPDAYINETIAAFPWDDKLLPAVHSQLLGDPAALNGHPGEEKPNHFARREHIERLQVCERCTG